MPAQFARHVRVTPKKRVSRAQSAQLRKLAALHRQRSNKKVLPYSDVTGKLDPHEFYENRARKLASEAKPGLEKFAYNVFGPSFIGSLALALDPYSSVRFPTVAITPANRTRKIKKFQGDMRLHTYVRHDSDFNSPDPSTPNLFDRTPLDHTTTTTNQSDGFNFVPQKFEGYCSDTTKRTRPIGSDYGTFELCDPYILAPPRYTDWWSHSYSRADPTGLGGIYYQVNDDHAHRINYETGPGFDVAKTTVDSLISDEVAFCSSMMSKHGLGLIRLALPEHKRYDIGYNLAELKDLPMMLRSTIEHVKHLSDLASFKGMGDVFLNQKFGWDSYVQSVYAMLRLPEKISKRINYLISRRGLPTRFTSTTRGVDPPSTSLPQLDYWIHTGESIGPTGWISRRDWTLRCVLNLTTKFPDVAIPKLRQNLVYRIFGVVPTPSTIYNLVPWTWLLEYFVGLGEYIDLIETIHSDHSVFNYGFLTYSSDVTNTFDLESRVTDTVSWVQSPGGNSTTSVIRKKHYSAVLGLKYRKRIDISTLSDVKAFSRPSTLSTDQLAILGALLTKFVHN